MIHNRTRDTNYIHNVSYNSQFVREENPKSDQDNTQKPMVLFYRFHI